MLQNYFVHNYILLLTVIIDVTNMKQPKRVREKKNTFIEWVCKEKHQLK